jgi:RNA polymerase sigma-70 factor (ECF subfamily)
VNATRITLLERAGAGHEDAWSALDRLYRPFILGWFRAQGASAADAEDLTQEVLATVFREIKDFDHSGRTGAFRSWIRQMCLHRLHGHRRAQKVRASAVGGSEFLASLNEIGASDDEPSRRWEQEHDRHVLRQLFESLAGELEDRTLEAFRRVAFEGAPVERVARELEMTEGAVYIAKSRVLRKLRALAAGLVDDAQLS